VDAIDIAATIISREYYPAPESAEPSPQFMGWELVIEKMKLAMAAEGLRPGSVGDYCISLQTLRNIFPSGVQGPNDVQPRHAVEYVARRMAAVSATTVRGNIVKMRALWEKWFMEKLGICGNNPWEGVALPRVDKKDPRVLSDQEEMKFLTWLEKRYKGWRLPVLWFMVKGFVGSRSADISGLKTEQLRDGRIYFPAEQAKGREDRPAILPPALFEELKAQAGPVFVFETFHTGLKAYYRTNRLRCGNYSCKTFNPKRLVRFLQTATAEFREAHPDIPYFKPHNFRGTAITRALELTNGNIDAVAIAFDCNPDTIRKYYAGLNKQQVADDVLSKLQARVVVATPKPQAEVVTGA